MIVAHCNGFYYLNGKFIPKEVVLCDSSFRWRGLTIKTDNILFSAKDLKANEFVSKNIHGIAFPPASREKETEIEDLACKVKSLMTTYFKNHEKKIYVKGCAQKAFFAEILPEMEVVNMGKFILFFFLLLLIFIFMKRKNVIFYFFFHLDMKWPNVKSLDVRKIPTHSLHTSEGYCAKDVCLAYAKFLKDAEEYWDV